MSSLHGKGGIPRGWGQQAGGVHPRLVVELLSISDMADCEYRLGDLTMWLIYGEQVLRPYAAVSVGETTLCTEPVEVAQRGPGAPAHFPPAARLRFAYRGEASARVAVRDRRGLQALLRGDPLLGEAELRLEGGASPRAAALPLGRGVGAPGAGTLALRYWLE